MRDINILCDTLLAEFKKKQVKFNKSISTDREYFTKRLLKGKSQRGIASDH